RERLFVVLIVDLTDDLFQQVFERKYAFESTVFVDDKHEMDLRRLHPLQRNAQRYRRWNKHRRPHPTPEIEIFIVCNPPHVEIFAKQQANNIVQILSINRQTRVAAGEKSSSNIVEISRHRQRDNVRTWHHRLLHLRVREVEDFVDQLLFFRFEITTLSRYIDQVSQLAFRINRSMLSARMQSKHTNDARARPIKQSYGPLEHFVKRLKRPRDSERNRFGTFERQCLRRELAQHDVQKRDDRKRDRKRDRVQGHF